MLQSNKRVVNIHQFPDSSKLWHNNKNKTESLGCSSCAFLDLCGGLRVDATVFDCNSFCSCVDKTKCDNVCSNRIDHYVARVQEVGGLDLSRIPREAETPKLSLPRLIPMIYNGSKRKAPLEFPIVALSLYQLFYKKTGDPKFSTRQALTSKFGISQHTEVILSGTEKDLALERWWALSNRDKVVENLLELGIKMVTTPNYSLFDDVPRTDNLYNMKRIALTCLELKRWGMPVALHINGRTERDYERWTEFLTEHDELDMLAFEFGTGAGRLTRIEWHAKQLQILAQKVNRPLTLIMRGGLPEYPTLKSAFQAVVFIDTDSFLRAQHRQVGCFDSGKIIWTPRETAIGEPIDNLIIQNVSAKSQYVDYLATKLT